MWSWLRAVSRFGLFFSVVVYFGVFWCALQCFGRFWSVLYCCSLFWTVQVCSGLFWTVLDCSALYWSVLVGSVLYSFGLFWTVRICSTLFCTAPNCSLMSWSVLDNSGRFWNVLVCLHCSELLCPVLICFEPFRLFPVRSGQLWTALHCSCLFRTVLHLSLLPKIEFLARATLRICWVDLGFRSRELRTESEHFAPKSARCPVLLTRATELDEWQSCRPIGFSSAGRGQNLSTRNNSPVLNYFFPLKFPNSIGLRGNLRKKN